MKKWSAILMAVLISLSASAQEEKEEGESRFFGGGNFGLAIGRYTLISVNPQVGYRFNRFLGAGLGLNLVYASQKQKDVYGNNYYKLVQGITGLNTFVRFYPTQRFMIQVQPEGNYIFGKEIYYQPVKESYKLNTEIIPSLLVGGGMVTPTGRGAAIFSVMYDVLQKPGSPYGNRPIVNVGYNFSF
ncbi:hypothetical protein HRH25_03810 [Flavisolibacter sp. BT320]|nr:hypothetical protein [Flavisolibacter longurius]